MTGHIRVFKRKLANLGYSMEVYSGSNTDYKSSEPLKTLVMLCYVKWSELFKTYAGGLIAMILFFIILLFIGRVCKTCVLVVVIYMY